MAKFTGPHIKCIVSGQPNSTEHHILTQKAWPEFKLAKWNRIPLSGQLHAEAHNKGMVHMSEEYHLIYVWLVDNGWELQEWPKKKWIHPMQVDGGH